MTNGVMFCGRLNSPITVGNALDVDIMHPRNSSVILGLGDGTSSMAVPLDCTCRASALVFSCGDKVTCSALCVDRAGAPALISMTYNATVFRSLAAMHDARRIVSALVVGSPRIGCSRHRGVRIVCRATS